MINRSRFGRPKYTLALTHGAAANTQTATDSQNGLLHEAIITTPATVDGAATATVSILDSDGVTIYSKASLAANTTTKDLLTTDTRVPISGSYTVKVVFSANQTATDTTTIVALLLDKG